MGNTEASQLGSDPESVLNHYNLIEKENDKRFGPVTLYRHKESKKLTWVKEILIPDEKSLEHYKNCISKSLFSDPIFIQTRPILIEADSKTQFCNNCTGGSQLIVFLEHFERELQGEITRRSSEKASPISNPP